MRGFVGVANLLWLCITVMRNLEAVTISSYYPSNGPVSGGTLIDVVGDGFITTGNGRSKCIFQNENGRASQPSPFNEIHNSTHLSCILPDVSFFSALLSERGDTIRLQITAGGNLSSNHGEILVYDPALILISGVTPNEGLTNTSNTLVRITGTGFIDTGQITCSLGTDISTFTPATYISSSILDCLVPLERTSSRLSVTVSLNGQEVGALPSTPDALMFTFYSPPPFLTSSYFSPSYAAIRLQFDRELEIGSGEASSSIVQSTPSAISPAQLEIDCALVLNSASLRLVTTAATCAWQNSQQRLIVISLSSESDIRDGTIIGIHESSLRTRYVPYSRLASGSVYVRTLPGLQYAPMAVLEAADAILACGDYVINGDHSLYGGYRSLEYAWRMGMDVDELGSLIPHPSLMVYIPSGFTLFGRLVIPSIAFYNESLFQSGSGSGSGTIPINTYSIELTVRNFLGLNSTTVLHNVATTSQLSPPVLIVGDRVREVQSWKEVILVGKVLRVASDCNDEFNVTRYLWRVFGEGVEINLEERTRVNSSLLFLPPTILQPGVLYLATLRVDFSTGQSTSANIHLESVMRLEARLSGGVRRGLGINDDIDLNGGPSIVYLRETTELDISWNCSVITVPELEASSSSCENFVGSNDLIFMIPAGVLPPGGYKFTLILTHIGENGSSLLQSSASQLIVIFPYSVPRVRLVPSRSTYLSSIPVDRRVVLQAEVVVTGPSGEARWSTEYVQGYGQLDLNSNVTTTRFQFSICSSISTCPYSTDTTPAIIYTSNVLTNPPRSQPFTNTISLILKRNVLLPQNSYRFKLSVRDSFSNVGFAEVDIQTESIPLAGRLEIDPAMGHPLSTIFSFEALDWTDSIGDGPFQFQFGFCFSCFEETSNSPSSLMCEEWMTGISGDSSFISILPYINPSLNPKFIVRVFDNNRGESNSIQRFSSFVLEPLSMPDSTLSTLMTDIETIVTRGSQWVQALGHMTSLVTSLHMDHLSIICSDELESSLSPSFQLSNFDIVELKMQGLHLVLNLYFSFIPPSESHHQVILSLLKKVTRIRCGYYEEENVSNEISVLDLQMIINLLENIVRTSNNFSEFGILSSRGLSTGDAKHILFTYQQILLIQRNVYQSNTMPRVRSNAITESLSGRMLEELGYSLCLRQGLHEDAAAIDLDGFMNVKSSHIYLPSEYIAGGCFNLSCPFEAVRVRFSVYLFSLHLQWPCATRNNSSLYCNGVYVTSTQIYLDILWQGNIFSSLIKAPILHLSLLNPATGIPLEMPSSPSSLTLLELSFPIIAPYSNSLHLACVVWEHDSLSWNRSVCSTDVLTSSSSSSSLSVVTCRCSSIRSHFYTVLESCPNGYYGKACNETCPQGLWGPECSISCDCNERGTCSAVDGSCDCDSGWMGDTCNIKCEDGFYGKLCNDSCLCENNAACNHVTGACNCTPGWIGSICNISCAEGLYGESCLSQCECRNTSECDFTTGACTCQAGFSGTTCHSTCPVNSFGLGCASECQCFVTRTRSCDHISGSCDCNDMWMGELCDVQIAPPTLAPVQTFQIWWAIVGLVGVLVVAVGVVVVVVVIVIFKKKKRRNKVLPTDETDGKGLAEEVATLSSISDEFVISRTKSLEVLIPRGKTLKDVFLSSPVTEIGTDAEFKEPPIMDGEYRWQIIQVMSEGGSMSEGKKSSSSDRDGRIVLESRESVRPENEDNISDSEGRDPDAQIEQTETLYGRGIYLSSDATLKELRNQFVDSEQLEQSEGVHFRFLRSDVPGDAIEFDTEDEILLSQIEHNLIQKRTLYIELLDSAQVMGDLCVCGRFTDLECTNCKKRGYCSKQCQEDDWSHHEEFCRERSARRERKRERRKSRNKEIRQSRSSQNSNVSLNEDTCVCGKDAEYECSRCKKQGYCSEECQREDWSIHEFYCNDKNARLRGGRVSQSSVKMKKERLQTVFEEPESPLEA